MVSLPNVSEKDVKGLFFRKLRFALLPAAPPVLGSPRSRQRVRPLYAVRALSHLRPAEIMKLHALSFFSKQFKLYRQLELL